MGHVNRNAATRPTTLLSWQEALAILENCNERGVPIPFAIVFCTADEIRHTGGEIIVHERAVWHVKGGRVARSADFERVKASTGKSRSRKKAPDEPATWSRRIRAVNNDQIRTVHPHLIMEINGQPVR